MTLMETLIKERDGARNDAMRLGIELVAEREARRATEACTEVFQ